MPEGDTIHRISRTMAPRLVGKVVERVEAPRLTDDVGQLVGMRITMVEARGKYLVIGFDKSIALLTHLRMKGKWNFYAPGDRWRYARSSLSVLIGVEGTDACLFSAPFVRFVRQRHLRDLLGADALGPDLLGESFDVEHAVAQLRREPDDVLGVALLDQWRVAGVGNVYKSEMCFHLRLDPFELVSRMADDALRDLLLRTRDVMAANVRVEMALQGRGASTPYGYRRDTSLGLRADGSRGCAQASRPISVYGRRGEPCFACGSPIEMRRQGPQQRSTYFCASCQRRA
jgi:endonuclease-8